MRRGNPAELLKEGVQSLSQFKTGWDTGRRLDELERVIPAGKRVTVTLVYEVYKPVPSEGLKVKFLKDVLPAESNPGVLQSGNPRHFYESQQVTVVGTGQDLERGAPVYPGFAEPSYDGPVIEARPNVSLNYDRWRSYERTLEKWRAAHPRQPPTVVQEKYVPQVDRQWLENSLKVTDQINRALAGHSTPDPSLGQVYRLLSAAQQRALANLIAQDRLEDARAEQVLQQAKAALAKAQSVGDREAEAVAEQAVAIATEAVQTRHDKKETDQEELNRLKARDGAEK